MNMIEQAIKKAQRDRHYKFQRKKHEKQFLLNTKVADRIDTANRRLSKVVPSSEKDKTTISQAMEEFKQDVAMINKRQKHIRIANQSEHHWVTVTAYIGSNVANDEEDAKS